MFREMKACCPGLLVAFCIISMFFAILSFGGNALVVLTIAFFSELHEITANIGLASLATSSLFHSTVLNSISFALGVNALFDGCPIFLIIRFSVFYFCHTLAFNSLFNLCIVSAEQYIAVTFPLRYLSILPKKRMVKLITVAWLSSFFIRIPSNIDSLASHVFLHSNLNFLLQYQEIFHFKKTQKTSENSSRGDQSNGSCKPTEFPRSRNCVLHSADTLTDTNKIETLALIKPWTSPFHIMYSAISPFVYFFRCKRPRKYSRKLLTKPLRLMSENFSKLIHFHL